MTRPALSAAPFTRASVYLYPGQIFASAEPTVITTILGTCVAVCLWDSVTRVGGMNHFMLARPRHELEASPRFGDTAMRRLLEQVLSLGGVKARLQAKVFSGMTGALGAAVPRQRIGPNNVDLALEHLAEANVPVVARDVLGNRGRKLIFHLDAGDAWVKPI